MKTPVLKTERLILRPFCEEDAPAVFHCWESDPDVARYMFWKSHDDIQKTREWIAFEMGQILSDTWFRFAVADKKDGKLIGTGLIYLEPEYQMFEVGYNFGRQYWGRGYATETMRAVLGFAKDTLKIKEVVGRYAKENSSSGKVMEKLGFAYEKDIVYVANEGENKYPGVLCRLVLSDIS